MRAIVLTTLSLALASAAPVLAQDSDPTREGTSAQERNRPAMRLQGEPGDESFYVVKKGDTLTEIARQELGDAQEWRHIAELNRIDEPKKLAVGTRLELPRPTRSDDSSKQEKPGAIFGR